MILHQGGLRCRPLQSPIARGRQSHWAMIIIKPQLGLCSVLRSYLSMLHSLVTHISVLHLWLHLSVLHSLATHISVLHLWLHLSVLHSLVTHLCITSLVTSLCATVFGHTSLCYIFGYISLYYTRWSHISVLHHNSLNFQMDIRRA